MKKRTDFVTNSSSSSYIICFARIADPRKAREKMLGFLLDKEIYNASGVISSMHFGSLGADWAGVELSGIDDVVYSHPDDKYVIIEDCNGVTYGDDEFDILYDYEFGKTPIINMITKENGFDDIQVKRGFGFNG